MPKFTSRANIKREKEKEGEMGRGERERKREKEGEQEAFVRDGEKNEQPER